MAELADAHGSGPCGSNTLWVRLPSSTPQLVKALPMGNAFFVVSDKMEPVRGAHQYENCRLEDFSTIFILNFID